MPSSAACWMTDAWARPSEVIGSQKIRRARMPLAPTSLIRWAQRFAGADIPRTLPAGSGLLTV
jgi:hypothetical protein